MPTDTVLLTSGYPESVVDEARKHWHVIDIASQREAIEHLRGMAELPAAVCIGYANSQDEQDLSAETALSQIQKLDPQVPVVISTGQTEAGIIVNLVKRGAFDYVVEPPHKTEDSEALGQYTQDLMLALTRAVQWRSLVRENQQLRQQRIRQSLPETIQVRSAAMLEIMNLVEKVAPTQATVLVTGESGTGKELIARAIHEKSASSKQPFTAINCAAINQSLLTSELFGHVKGSFTGADSDRPGLIREAGAGSLFLDEIGAVPGEFQVSLLRVLDQRRARPVGANSEYAVRCRFIAAANQDLEAMVERGTFREDLYYRLNLFHIQLPPLRDRKGEIPVLAHHFLRHCGAVYGKAIEGIEPAAMRMLEAYDWPGNVRQLRNVIERAAILCEGTRITIAQLSDQIRGPAAAVAATPEGRRYQDAMRQFESQMIRRALANADGNLSQAARALDMNRTTLSYRIKQLGIPRSQGWSPAIPIPNS
jgi:DNA-binding NtrC family response regulator